MARQRPINAGVPASGEQGGKPPAPQPKQGRPPRRRPRLTLPLKLIAGALLLAVVFIAAAIVGGGSGRKVGVGGGGGGAASPGPPTLSTNNTSRIDGDGPAANAAGAALAVFPSIEESQRPAAVTLVDESDWAGAIAASVLMAIPVRAPILFAAGEELPEVTGEALDALDPQGDRATGGAALFAIGDVPLPGDRRATRIGGSSPAATAAAIAALRDRLFGAPPQHIVLASEAEPGFAMPAAAWAARSGDPVLFAGREELPKATARALQRHPRVPVYVLGPSSAISSAVVRAVAKIDPRVRRVASGGPVENAIALARYHGGGFGWDINDPGHGFVVARSDSPLDAAAAAPLSASGTWGPLLLSDNADTLPDALREYLVDVKPGYTTDPTRAFYNHVWVIGDQKAISVAQQAEIDSLAELAKIGGKGR